ncbi:SAM-dependent methyltransferase [Streptomyces sp. F63]|uniref:SAM-dependent methyltransferase n=1 Tax=Streptomyces sp. F63 TaxID=2824887 RepID=UPI001B35CB73|nr:SAM-dependent methyltransferase [Streptomyces sp. F63]MBQ0985898.1 SAM-dependent methyltransferase [Streptomyces sp. F63]
MSTSVSPSTVARAYRLVQPSCRASSARLSNYLLGGKDHYESDRQLAARLLQVAPWLERAEDLNCRFAGYATAVAADRGVGQFLDLGCGLPRPFGLDLHEVALTYRDRVRVLYVDHDLHVIAHARALMNPGDPVVAAHLPADVLDIDRVLSCAAKVFDLGRPVAVSLHGVLDLCPDDGAVRAMLDALVAWLPAGSCLSISHLTGDFRPEDVCHVAALCAEAGLSLRPRSRQEVIGFFNGLEVLDPGVTAISEQLRGALAFAHPPEVSAAWSGIAVKP